MATTIADAVLLQITVPVTTAELNAGAYVRADQLNTAMLETQVLERPALD